VEGSAPKVQAEGGPQRDSAEIEALCKRNTELEKELAEARRLLAETESERDLYKHACQAEFMKQFSEEDLRRFAENDDETGCQALDQFIGELEAIVNGSEDSRPKRTDP
jgi:hypothetical protein